MKILIPIIFILQVLFSQDIFESFDSEGSTKYKGKTIYEFDINIAATPIMRIQNVKGDIYIKGIPGNSAQIKEIVRVKTSSKSKAYELFSKYRSMVQYHEESNLIEVIGKGKWPSRISFDYEITVPKSISTFVHTSGGDIDIEQIVNTIINPDADNDTCDNGRSNIKRDGNISHNSKVKRDREPKRNHAQQPEPYRSEDQTHDQRHTK